ncbi:MAG: TIGR02266 family protein [Deltaproteobacteria bacterium]|nr:MAG: TIGR02266 family protein [Deltaproteobacteria bacterium]TMB28156.1 MAG: TIGR02266 family protein [Deltaproteobacteria bacterium]
MRCAPGAPPATLPPSTEARGDWYSNGVKPQRAPVVFPVRFEASGEAIQSTTRQVSVEGVFVRSQKSPKEGTVLSLRLYLPGNMRPDEVRARVVEVRPEPDCGFWAEFVEPSPATIDGIKLLLQRRARAAAGGPGTPIGVMNVKQNAPSAVAAQPQPVEARRAFPRHAARFQVGFSSNQEFVLEYAENISAGGVFVQTEQPMELESIVTVSLRLPGNEVPVEAKGVIVHCVSKEDAARIGKHAGIGVQFLDSSDEFREAIDRAIEHILQNG